MHQLVPDCDKVDPRGQREGNVWPGHGLVGSGGTTSPALSLPRLPDHSNRRVRPSCPTTGSGSVSEPQLSLGTTRQGGPPPPASGPARTRQDPGGSGTAGRPRPCSCRWTWEPTKQLRQEARADLRWKRRASSSDPRQKGERMLGRNGSIHQSKAKLWADPDRSLLRKWGL